MSFCKPFVLSLILVLFMMNHTQANNVESGKLKYECTIDPDGKTFIVNDKNKEIKNSVNKKMFFSRILNQEPYYTLTIKCDSMMSAIYIFQPNPDIDFFLSDDMYEYQVALPAGIYEFFTYIRKAKHHFIYLYKKNIQVGSDTTIHLSANEANILTEFDFYREDNSRLVINSLGFQYILEPNTFIGVGFTHLNLDSTGFILEYNDLPDYFQNSWLVKGKQDWNLGNIYLINNYLGESTTDTVITNDPLNLAYADIVYQFPDSIWHNGSLIQVGTNAPGFHYYPNDRNYTVPFQFRVYQDTSANFSLDQSRFSQTVNATKAWGTEIKTSEMKIGNRRVYGYLSPSEYSEPLTLSESQSLNLGVSPTFWAGRFRNSMDSIKVGLEFGFRNNTQLFLSMTNDVINQPYTVLSLYSDDNSIDSTILIYPVFKDELAFFGYRDSDLMFRSAGNKCHEMKLLNLHSEVAKEPASSVAYAFFDLRKGDKNPPYMRSFQIMSDHKITNTLESTNNNIIRVNAKDDNVLSDVQLAYSHYNDSNWIELYAEYVPPYYTFKLPELDDGYYSLKIYLADSSQNWIENVMEPAFHMGEISTIEKEDPIQYPTKIYLSEGYPNPFNSAVRFEYIVPNVLSGSVNISVFDILGKKVCSLVSSIRKPGKYTTYWHAVDNRENPVSSGMYFIRMKGGDQQTIRKVLLMR